ncbi:MULTISPECIES: hypothetical protein [unclassified Neisseria]|uniref:hypothetical protein n=1 Tax=unclassified Neisseria TaxID=2623750 RepID=UPI000559C7F5|nr:MULTISPECIES: hypothetical protein [unclassified Neisseria]OFL96150.1 hypothetical protein HMPREF2726_09250 [Neisseria sp. HMSC074B07]
MIGGENSRKPVFGFRLLEEKKFCKGLKQIKNKGNISHINKRHKTAMTGRKGFEKNNKVLEINSNRINDKATIDDNIKRMVFISGIKGSKSSFTS